MRAWPVPDLPALPVTAPPVRVHDSSSGELVETRPGGPARVYVCGITPYDATHVGHAATFVAFDLLNRAWRNAGHQVVYVQNVTDVDDPLFERAAKVGVDWRDLAARETELFRQDMAALRVIPPDHFPGAEESLGLIVDLILRLQDAGVVYHVEDDLYFSVSADPAFGEESGWTRAQMLEVFADRGGDPDRPGKKDPLDCLVWRAERSGEPALDSLLGRGRPGWHVECTAMALELLGERFDVQGGGTDLIFPHHEMCASEAQVLTGSPYARAYVHAGMVAYDGEKMSKSKGNLVFVSQLRNSDVDPMAIRLTLLRHHYRSDWEWTEAGLWDSLDVLDRWRRALASDSAAPTGPVVDAVLSALADDLDAPAAVAAIDAWAAATSDLPQTEQREGGEGRPDGTMRALLDAALGLTL